MDVILKWVLRAPAVAYDLGAGPLLRHRFLLLTHRGRRSGRHYRTMLEVLHWNDELHEAVVISGLGPRAQWLQNVLAGGTVEIRIGRERWPAVARPLDAPEAAAVLADYDRRNRLMRPLVHRLLTTLTGTPYDGTAAPRLAVVQALPLVAFRPAHR